MPHPVDCRCQLCQDEELYRRRATARQFTAQTRTAEEIMARLDAATVAAAAAVGLKAVRGTGAMADCVFLTIADPATDGPDHGA